MGNAKRRKEKDPTYGKIPRSQSSLHNAVKALNLPTTRTFKVVKCEEGVYELVDKTMQDVAESLGIETITQITEDSGLRRLFSLVPTVQVVVYAKSKDKLTVGNEYLGRVEGHTSGVFSNKFPYFVTNSLPLNSLSWDEFQDNIVKLVADSSASGILASSVLGIIQIALLEPTNTDKLKLIFVSILNSSDSEDKITTLKNVAYKLKEGYAKSSAAIENLFISDS